MKLQEITDCLEAYAPLALQESYDNAGLKTSKKEVFKTI
jgi:putative NIF3 family GTP cyclohydrolase 1 type 2